MVFQSSPDPKAGCDLGTRAGFLRLYVGFQSSPDPKAGCDVLEPIGNVAVPLFQSSPDPKAGCD